MACHRRYDTVAFDVREHTMILFFGRTSPRGEIDDYLLIMRGDGGTLGNSVYIEVNEQQFSGDDLIREARLGDNMLTLELHEPAPALDGSAKVVLSYDGSAANRACVEAGAFRVLGDYLTGGHA